MTSATAERTFSTLRRLKNYLRSNMSQERLNHTIILHTCKDRTDMSWKKLQKNLLLLMNVDFNILVILLIKI